jgi:hypothetical protein
LKDSLADLTTIHEFRKHQRKPLAFTVLGVRKSEKAKGAYLCGRSSCAKLKSRTAEATTTVAKDFLFFLPNGRP